MKTIDIADATAPLGDYAAHVEEESVVVTKDGRPIAMVLSICHEDLDSLSLGMNPAFQEFMDGNRRTRAERGTLSLEDMRARLGLDGE